MVKVMIGCNTYSKLEDRSIEELEYLLELAIGQVNHHLNANQTIPAKRYNTFKYYRERFAQQVTILENVIAEKKS